MVKDHLIFYRFLFLINFSNKFCLGSFSCLLRDLNELTKLLFDNSFFMLLNELSLFKGFDAFGPSI